MNLTFEYEGKKISLVIADRNDFSVDFEDRVAIGIKRKNIYEESIQSLSSVNDGILRAQVKAIQDSLGDMSSDDARDLNIMADAISDLLKGRQHPMTKDEVVTLFQRWGKHIDPAWIRNYTVAREPKGSRNILYFKLQLPTDQEGKETLHTTRKGHVDKCYVDSDKLELLP